MSMTTAELSHLTSRLADEHKRLKMGEVADVPLSKNDLYTLLVALDLYGAVKRITQDLNNR